MPPYGLYSLANTPEELLSRGYGTIYNDMYDPAFGQLRSDNLYASAPFTGSIPFQNINRLTGYYDPVDIPSFGGISGYRNVGDIDTLPELDTSRFTGVDLESGYLDRAGSSDQDIYAEQEKQKGDGIGGLFRFLLGLAVPGSGLFMGDTSALQGIKNLNQRLRATDFGQSKTLQEYFQRREARKDAERLQTVGQQLQQASERGGGYQPTSTREQNVARTESRRADKGLGQGGVYGL